MSEEKKIGGRAFGETLNVEKFIEEQVALIREQVGDGKVLLALSGGVDSSVVAALLLRAIGDQLYCVHVNHGLMRKGESEQVIKVFREELGANLTYVDATDRFLDKLAGVSEPERKRKIIGEEFIHVFEEEAAKLQGIHFLGQGTIYPDIVESDKGVKAHHNVGGLPEKLGFELVEPVKYLFKDEVRAGRRGARPARTAWCGVSRSPAPASASGASARSPATVSPPCVSPTPSSARSSQSPAWTRRSGSTSRLSPDIRTTGVVDGKRTELWPVIIRAVNTTDAMTASVPRLDWELLETVTRRVQAEVPGVSRVLYDLSPEAPCDH